MSKGPWRVKPRELRRVVESVRATGLTVSGVEIDRDGKIIVLTGDGKNSETPGDEIVL